MKTAAEFEAFYAEVLLPKLKPLEEDRLRVCRMSEEANKKAWKQFFNYMHPFGWFFLICCVLTKAFIPIIPWFLAPFAALILFGIPIAGWIILAPAFAFTDCLTARENIAKNFRSDFKEVVIAEIATFLDVHYEARNTIPQGLWDEGQLFYPKYNRYSGEDLIHGKLGDTAIMLSELRVSMEVEDGGWGFSGVYMVADFNKSLSGITYVMSKDLLAGQAPYLVQNKKDDFQKITLESPEFENRFTVYTNDIVDSRYVLSTSLMDRMVAYQRKWRWPVRYAFQGSKLYVAADKFKDLLEPDLYKTLLDKEAILLYYEQFSMLLAIVEDLNLNTRIWSKQAS